MAIAKFFFFYVYSALALLHIIICQILFKKIVIIWLQKNLMVLKSNWHLLPLALRLGICQKIYTTQFSGEKILHTENA